MAHRHEHNVRGDMPSRPRLFRTESERRASAIAAREYEARRRVEDTYRAWYRLAVWAAPNGLRAQQLARQPLCEIHLARGRVVAADTVNHRARVSGGASEAERWSLFVDARNHQSVCAHCHSGEVQAQERAASRRG
jgi:5-methylcytosine-specific restriction protein A